MPVTADDVRRLALSLPRTTEGLVRDSPRWRIGRLVYAALSPDEELLGFAYPKEGREALVAGDPDTFLMPRPSDLRYNWVRARMAALDADELAELIVDAWRMCVPKRVAAEWEAATGGPGATPIR
ncbi:MAG TPA: MmcQ/YjbR family DNA-binding protein [Mycobacteriales bacterium]|nr:MmcQ/YjbR family DNA-binding protein [Mycobacteriales bacterium]